MNDDRPTAYPSPGEDRLHCAICGVPGYASTPALPRDTGARLLASLLHWCRSCGDYACIAHFRLDTGYCETCMNRRYPAHHAAPLDR